MTSAAKAEASGLKVLSLDDAQALSIDLSPYGLSPAQDAARQEAIAQARSQTPKAIEPGTRSERLQAAQDAKVSARLEYLVDLLNLPEATGRIKATKRLAACHTRTSMPLERAALMLAALPLDDAPPAPVSQTTAAQEGALRRKAELRLAALTHRIDAGDYAVRDEHNAISYALKLHNGQGMRMSEALEQCNVEI